MNTYPRPASLARWLVCLLVALLLLDLGWRTAQLPAQVPPPKKEGQ